MTTIALTDIWEVIELMFQKNYTKLQSIPDFKIMSKLNNENKFNQTSLIIPYWTLFTNEDYVEYITNMYMHNRPYYDYDLMAFVLNANDLLVQINDILFHLHKIFQDDEDLKYKLFVIEVIKNQHRAYSSIEEDDVASLFNNLHM
jgi:hypothetical protein|tara:strand:+ start:160 stop:594 length:435 start_codon:yes stop_codon:yes gene_type:complete